MRTIKLLGISFLGVVISGCSTVSGPKIEIPKRPLFEDVEYVAPSHPEAFACLRREDAIKERVNLERCKAHVILLEEMLREVLK